MSRSALIIGGTGLIGRALVPVLQEEGWDLTVVSRNTKPSDPTVHHVVLERDETSGLQKVMSNGYDALIDVVPLTARAGDQLAELHDAVETMVVISSAAVYADAEGKSLLNSDLPRSLPISEEAPVVAPDRDSDNYPGVKVYIEKTVLEQPPANVTILRPGAIYGPGDTASREWHFAKRALDRRPFVIMRAGGHNVFHQVAAENVARIAARAAESPGTRVLNCGDESPRSVRDTSRMIAKVMDHVRDEFSVEEGILPETLGLTPWSTPQPIVLDTSRARSLGHHERAHPLVLMERTCEWLVEATAGRRWEQALPGAAHHYGTLFDYDAEDQWFRKTKPSAQPLS
ncbi:MAG: NAD-dependent epimerase/dehydratase family protein [Actinomycetota bacterium]|nr:NAD-dependent epimerase/dehydratase family protein [Actinomycetota bacterium]